MDTLNEGLVNNLALIWSEVTTNNRKGNHAYALAYLKAIPEQDQLASELGVGRADALRHQLLYVLNNLQSWQGPVAREVKKALNAFCKQKDTVDVAETIWWVRQRRNGL
jgi:hypothetical protein